MHIQLGFLLLLVSFTAWAQPAQQEVNELFSKYEAVMNGEKANLMEVFSPEFLSEPGNTKDFQKSADKSSEKDNLRYELVIQPSRRNPNLAYVKRIPAGSSDKPHSSFVLVKHNGKWVIQGTLSDDE